MSDLINQIRDYINNPRQQYLLLQDRANWNLLCSSMDALGDTETALDAYLLADESKTDGEKYTAIYGILQVLFVQQDALQHLAESLAVDYEVDPLLKEIREIRNDSVGHPTKRGGGKGKSFNFTSRISLSKDSFELMTTYPNDEPKFQTVNVVKLIETQKGIVEATLNNVIEKLKKEEMEHKEQFKDKKLVDAFPSTLGYYFEKIHEAIRGEKPREFGLAHLDFIISSINSFKEA